MPEIDEQEIERRLQRLGELMPSAEATRRALDRGQMSLNLDEQIAPAARRGRRTILIALTSAAALVLLLGTLIFAYASGMFQRGGEQEIVRPLPPPILEQPEHRDVVPPVDIVEDDSDPPPQIEPVDEKWGSLTGTFVLVGEAPQPRAVLIASDGAFCGKHEIVDESLVVNPKNHGIQNILVWLRVKRGAPAVVPHPSYDNSASDAVLLQNLNCRFEPHIALVRTSQTLLVRNADPVSHNTKIESSTPYNPLIPVGAETSFEFKSPERLPCRVSCAIHPWMNAWLFVQDHPYMTVTDKNGRFELANLPAGKLELQFWHEKFGYVREVTIDGKPQKWMRGCAEFDIRPAMTDLGVISVQPDDHLP